MARALLLDAMSLRAKRPLRDRLFDWAVRAFLKVSYLLYFFAATVAKDLRLVQRWSGLHARLRFTHRAGMLSGMANRKPTSRWWLVRFLR